jgi:hypothetical protein
MDYGQRVADGRRTAVRGGTDRAVGRTETGWSNRRTSDRTGTGAPNRRGAEPEIAGPRGPRRRAAGLRRKGAGPSIHGRVTATYGGLRTADGGGTGGAGRGGRDRAAAS